MDTLDYQVKETIAECAGIPFASVNDSDTLAGELDLDSLEIVNLAQDLEEAFHIELQDADIRADMTVQQLVEVVSRVSQAA